MNNFFVDINNNYSNLLSLIVSIIIAVITLLYVIFTYKQMKATKESVKMLINQINLDKQPCVVPVIKKGYSHAEIDNGRRWLIIEFDLNNIGTFSAVSVMIVSHLNLKYTTTKKGTHEVPMTSTIEYQPFIAVNEKKELFVAYENKEIEYLIKDLEISYNKNVERLKNAPHLNHYRGTTLIIQIFYKNLLGQWFKTELSQEIAWFNDNNLQINGHNLNSITVPPNELNPKHDVDLQFSWLSNSQIDINPIDTSEVNRIIKNYSQHQPEIMNLLNNSPFNT